MNPIIPKYLIAAGGGALVGSLVTFFITRSVVSKNWQAIADEQIKDIKEHYRVIRKEGELADPENLVPTKDEVDAENPYEGALADDEERQVDLKRLADMIASEGYDAAREIIGISEEAEPNDTGIFKDAVMRVKGSRTVELVEESLYDKVVPEGPDGEPRDPQYPYIISIDEWAVPDDEWAHFEMVTVNYYAGDDTLLDSAEEIVLDKDALVGAGTLSRFGHLSQDEDIVYVRNEQLGLSIEIVRNEEGYAESRGLNFDAEEEAGFERQRRIQRKKAKQSAGD